MSKKNLPNIPIYIGDWERDCNVLSLECEMAWMKIVFKMHLSGKQSFKVSRQGLINLWKTDNKNSLLIIDSLIKNNLCLVKLINGGFIFIQNCIQNKTCSVYIIRLKSEFEDFIKIGITSNLKWIKNRYRSYGFYDIIILNTLDFSNRKSALLFEKETHNKFHKYKHNPLTSFGGKTECFNINILNLI